VFWSRRRHRRPAPVPDPPAETTQENIERAKEEARSARDQLRKVELQAPAVETAAEKLQRIQRENNIGPRFWEALGQRRA